MKIVRSTVALLALTAVLLAGWAPPASASGEGQVLLTGAPSPHNGLHRAIDVIGDTADRLWFASLDRVVTAGSAADATCGGANDGHACGRIGRVSPNGSVRYFRGPQNIMESPIAVATYRQTAFAADVKAHSIWRVRNGESVAREVVALFAHDVVAPTDLLVRGETVWFAGSDYTGSINSDTQRRVGRIGRFNVGNPAGTIESWRVPELRDLAGLAFDANGMLWYSGNGNDSGVGIGFGRLNPRAANPGASRQVFRRDQFTAVTGSFPSAPSEMITGPDGKIWFVDNGTSQIGRFAPGDPLGSFEFLFAACDGVGAPPPPDPDGEFRCGGRLFDLARGPDGAVWYTRTRESEVGRITAAGVVTSITPAIPGFETPWAIARQNAGVGHAARLVITLPGSGAIGWFVP